MKSKQQKQTEAAYRKEFRTLHSDALQLQALDARLGVGVGATKERARLRARMAPGDATLERK